MNPPLAVGLGDGDGVGLAVGVGDAGGLGVGLGDGVGLPDGLAVGVADGDALAVGLGALDGLAVGLGDPVGLVVGLGLGVGVESVEVVLNSTSSYVVPATRVSGALSSGQSKKLSPCASVLSVAGPRSSVHPAAALFGSSMATYECVGSGSVAPCGNFHTMMNASGKMTLVSGVNVT
jgi:hypothetical protein